MPAPTLEGEAARILFPDAQAYCAQARACTRISE